MQTLVTRRALTIGPLVMAVAFVVATIAQAQVERVADPNWTAPRTADGHPDLQGMWGNKTMTPMERPASLEGRAYLSPEEMAEMASRRAESRARANAPSEIRDEPLPVGGSIGGYNSHWLDSGDTVLSTGQTSLIVDPPDGRARIKPWALAAKRYNLERNGDHYLHMSVWDRCVSRGVPGSMLPAGYNNAYRILQTADHVIIQHEMIHDARIIPVSDRPFVDPAIKLWMGDSRAYWEGDTLVVEMKNFTNKGWIASSGAGARLKGIPTSERLHVVERYQRVSEDTILWRVTVTDPNVYDAPFTIQMPLTRYPDYEIYEYACHEGNWAVRNALSGERVLDARAATEPAP